MNITEQLRNNGTIEQLASQFGVDTAQVEEIVKNAIPELTSNIRQNTSSPEGLNSFLNAARDHQDDPVEDMLANPNRVDTNDGDKILGHIFGNRRNQVEDNLSNRGGITKSNTSGILKFLAPIVLAMVAKNLTTKPGNPFQPKKDTGSVQAPNNRQVNNPFESKTVGNDPFQVPNNGTQRDNDGGLLGSIFGNKDDDKNERKSGNILEDILGNIF